MSAGHDIEQMRAMKPSFVAATAWSASLVSAVVSLSSVADVELPHFASTAAAAREEARLAGRNREQQEQQQQQRLSLRHLEAMWHTSLGIEVSYFLWSVYRGVCVSIKVQQLLVAVRPREKHELVTPPRV